MLKFQTKLLSSLKSLTANDGRARPGSLQPADPGAVAEHDESLLALVLNNLALGELRLVPREDDGVSGQAWEATVPTI